jgi:hypothetical protein
MMDSIHDNEQNSAASSKTVSSLVDIPRNKAAGAPKTGTGDAKGGRIRSGGPGSYAALSGDAKDDRGILLAEKDNAHDERVLKKQKNATEASAKPAAPAPPPQSGAGDFSAARLYDAKKKCEKSGADLERIIKLKEVLEMEYVKALCTAYVDEMERDKIEARALQLSAAPHTDPCF